MAGLSDLNKILQSMNPVLNEGEYVFATLPHGAQVPYNEAIACIREQEGLSVILPLSAAQRLGVQPSFIARWVTLSVHTALDAPGFTACFSAALEQEGISVNVVAGNYHDHLFIASEQAEACMQVLRRLSQSAQ